LVATRKHPRKNAVHPVDEPALRAKVRRQGQRLQGHAAEPAASPCFEEEPDVRVAEAIDRLHGIADKKKRSPIAGRPACGEPLEQFALSERCVLELIDEKVLDARVES